MSIAISAGMMAAADKLTPAQLTESYIKLRNKRDALRADEKLLNLKMELIAGLLLNRMDALQQDAFQAVGYTVFRSLLTTVSVVDREQFFDLVKTNGLFDLLEARASKEAVVAYAELNGKPPDGVELGQLLKVNVRKGR